MALSNYIGDTFNRTNESSWGDAETGDDTNKTWTYSTGATPSVAPNEAILIGSEAYHVAVVGDDHDDITEATTHMALVTPDDPAPGAGVVLRSTGAANSGYAVVYGSLDSKARVYKNGVLQTDAIFTLTEGGLWVKARVEDISGVARVSYKMWSDLEAEPGSWTVFLNDNVSPILSGKAGLLGTTAGIYAEFTLQGETVPDPEPDPGLPGGADDPSRAPPTNDAWSRKSLQSPFDYRYRLPPLPPKQPSPTQSMWQVRRR